MTSLQTMLCPQSLRTVHLLRNPTRTGSRRGKASPQMPRLACSAEHRMTSMAAIVQFRSAQVRIAAFTSTGSATAGVCTPNRGGCSTMNGAVMKTAGSALVVLMFVACATSAPDRAVKAASSLDVMQQNSSKARSQIDTVLSSLDTMLNAPADRLRETYDRYDKDVKKMNQYAEAIRENDTDLRKKDRKSVV